jgi:hypothetical protein
MINGEVPEDNQNGHGTEELELSNMYKAYVSGLNFIGNDPRKYGPKYATDVLTYLHVLDPEILIDWENPWNLTIFLWSLHRCHPADLPRGSNKAGAPGPKFFHDLRWLGEYPNHGLILWDIYT